MWYVRTLLASRCAATQQLRWRLTGPWRLRDWGRGGLQFETESNQGLARSVVGRLGSEARLEGDDESKRRRRRSEATRIVTRVAAVDTRWPDRTRNNRGRYWRLIANDRGQRLVGRRRAAIRVPCDSTALKETASPLVNIRPDITALSRAGANLDALCDSCPLDSPQTLSEFKSMTQKARAW